jgi:fatty acid desaturase
MNAEPTHREAIAALDGLELGSLKETANHPALLRLCAHAGLLIGCGVIILLAQNWFLWIAALVVYAVALSFLFAVEHETIHGTAFRSPWLNVAVAEVCGFFLLLPPRYFRYFHFAHHRHTQNFALDPELGTPKPDTLDSYLFHLSGIPYWRTAIAGLVHRAWGVADESFIPASGRAKVVSEARLHASVIVALAAASIGFQWTWPLTLWVLPALIGQPFLRAYLLAEHAACPLVADMLSNSRTTYTTSFVRFIAWNMPYHSAHHAMPTVPFHRLPDLNDRLRDRLKCTALGYIRAHRQIRSGFSGST